MQEEDSRASRRHPLERTALVRLRDFCFRARGVRVWPLGSGACTFNRAATISRGAVVALGSQRRPAQCRRQPRVEAVPVAPVHVDERAPGGRACATRPWCCLSSARRRPRQKPRFVTALGKPEIGVSAAASPLTRQKTGRDRVQAALWGADVDRLPRARF